MLITIKEALLQIDKKVIIETLKSEIPNILAIYIFGSFANGTANEKSDIDIAYLSKTKLSSLDRWNISQKLANKLMRDVDLVDLYSANTVFKYQIVSNSERIYGSGYEVEYFETLVYSQYLRFKEERQPIVDEIIKNKTVFGDFNG